MGLKAEMNNSRRQERSQEKISPDDLNSHNSWDLSSSKRNGIALFPFRDVVLRSESIRVCILFELIQFRSHQSHVIAFGLDGFCRTIVDVKQYEKTNERNEAGDTKQDRYAC